MEHSSRTPEQRKSGLVKGQVVTPRLAEHEATIERGRRAFYETGLALAAIRDGKLYKPSYHSFDAYCRQRWELSRSHADRLIVAAQRVRQLGELAPMGVILGVVLNERQARALGARVPFVKQRIGNGQAPGEAIQAELEQRHQGREQARQLHAGTHGGYPRQRVQERQALTLGSWKGRLNALLLDLEELPEEDRQAAVTELREEVAALD